MSLRDEEDPNDRVAVPAFYGLRTRYRFVDKDGDEIALESFVKLQGCEKGGEIPVKVRSVRFGKTWPPTLNITLEYLHGEELWNENPKPAGRSHDCDVSGCLR